VDCPSSHIIIILLEQRALVPGVEVCKEMGFVEATEWDSVATGTYDFDIAEGKYSRRWAGQER
jgi:hypothetical protein